MKIICTLLSVAFGILVCLHSANCQSPASVKKSIEQANKKFIQWFNTSQADSIITQYHTNACITGRGCGRTTILEYYRAEAGRYTVRDLATDNITLINGIATENGRWKILLANGSELTGKYQTEWQQVNNRWVILKETMLE